MSARQLGLTDEHAALARHLGSIQERVSKLVREKDMALTAMTGELLRLRARLVMARTVELWAMQPLTATQERV